MASLPNQITVEIVVDTESMQNALNQIEEVIRKRENWLQRLIRKVFKLSP